VPHNVVAPELVTTLRVRYAETDRMGVVYYANYLVWFEVARAELMRSLGWSYREMEESGVILPVIEAHCEYKRPARYDDEVRIRTTAEIQSPVRMTFRYQVSINGDSAVVATGHTCHAATTPEGRPCRLPDRVREVFA
jgi:acyl-CoA thioester hydrolase